MLFLNKLTYFHPLQLPLASPIIAHTGCRLNYRRKTQLSNDIAKHPRTGKTQLDEESKTLVILKYSQIYKHIQLEYFHSPVVAA